MRSSGTIAAILCLSLAACQSQGIGTGQVVGGLGGAAAGGLVGSQFGKGGGKLAATGLGVLVGAILGSQVGKALDQADQAALQRNTQQALSAPVGQPIVWNNPQNGNQVAVTPTRDGYAGDQYCREYQQTVTVGGQRQTAYGTACRQPDGSWKIANN
jgi:surface antigen